MPSAALCFSARIICSSAKACISSSVKFSPAAIFSASLDVSPPKAFKIIDKDIFSAKLEQEILGKITTASSACEASLVGKGDNNLKEAVASLKTVINQRTALSK